MSDYDYDESYAASEEYGYGYDESYEVNEPWSTGLCSCFDDCGLCTYPNP